MNKTYSYFKFIFCILFSNFLLSAYAQEVSTVAGSAMGYADGTGTGSMFRYPAGVAADGAGNLYVADITSSCIRKVRLSDGLVTTFAGSVSSSGFKDGIGAAAIFNQPIGLALDKTAGILYVSETNNHCIRAINLSSGSVTRLAGGSGMYGYGSTDAVGTNARFYKPNGLALDGNGNLYVADMNNHKIRKINIASGSVSTLAGSKYSGNSDGVGTGASFNNPIGLVYDGNGNLYLSDYSNHRICKINIATAAVTTIAGATDGGSGYVDAVGTAARFNNPYGMSIDANGNLYVADYNNTRIRKIKIATGNVTTLTGGGGGYTDGNKSDARFSYVIGLTFDENGNLYVGDSFNYKIRKIAASALPIVWDNLNANIANEQLNINWQCNNEVANSYFEIEISEDGNHFIKIATIQSDKKINDTYQFHYDMNNINATYFVTLFFIALFGYNKPLKKLFGFIVSFLILGFIFSGCTKDVHTMNTNKLFVRIVQVAANGSKTTSKTIQALKL